jgi:hypothetical protein
MKLNQRLSLQQLVAAALTGALLCHACTWLQMISWPSNWALLPIAALFALGLWASVAMQSAIENGIANQCWTDEVIETIRQRLQRTRCTVALSLLFLLPLLFFVCLYLFAKPAVSTGHHPSRINFAYFWAYPLLTHSTLVRILRPRPLAHAIVWNSEIKPIASEHWGERA